MTDFITTLNDTLGEIADLRLEQIENEPELEGLDPFLGASDLKRSGQAAAYWRQVNAARKGLGSTTSDGLLIEAVHVATAESEPAELREHLLNLAAEAVRAIDALDALVESFEVIEVEEKKANKK